MECPDNANMRKIFETDEEFDEFVEEVMVVCDDDWAQEYETAEEYIKNLLDDADSGNAESQFIVAEMFNMMDRFEEAEKYYRMAADQGNSNAQCSLGDLLAFDEPEEAEKYFRLAAEQGNSDAQLRLGFLLENAGRSEDAEKCFQSVMESDDSDSQASLCFYYINTNRAEEAEKYLHIVETSGKADTLIRLGLFFEDKNPEKAEKYYRTAAELGSTDAIDKLVNLLSDMDRCDEAEKFRKMYK